VKVQFLEGKPKSERNKLIAAILLGVLAIFALWFAFFRGSSSSSTKVSVNVNAASPRAGTSPANPTQFVVPNAAEQEFNYVTTPVVYNPGMIGAPDPGRNIFAFYEPPPPCPTCPTPFIPPPPVKPPTPEPTPVFLVSGMNPQSLYAGSKAFRLEIFGERFTPDSKVYLSQTEFPTTFISPQRLAIDVPANVIASEGQRQVIVQTPDGRAYSNQAMLMVQAPPKPQFQYIGMIGRKRYNNDTAYFIETGKPNATPITGRLNDVLGGRFRLLSINSDETLFEDTSLGFKHRLPLVRTPAGGSGGGLPGAQPGARGFPPQPNPNMDPSFMPYNPTIPQGEIPGIPSNIPRYIPPQPAANRNPTDKKDVDDDDPR
jgi:hypothetical protein